MHSIGMTNFQFPISNEISMTEYPIHKRKFFRL